MKSHSMQWGWMSMSPWVNRFLEYMLILMYVTCGQSGRGSEVSSLLYNYMMDRNRNILIEDGQIMFVCEYHKSMAMMDDVKVNSILIDRLTLGYPEISSISIESTFGHLSERDYPISSIDQSKSS